MRAKHQGWTQEHSQCRLALRVPVGAFVSFDSLSSPTTSSTRRRCGQCASRPATCGVWWSCANSSSQSELSELDAMHGMPHSQEKGKVVVCLPGVSSSLTRSQCEKISNELCGSCQKQGRSECLPNSFVRGGIPVKKPVRSVALAANACTSLTY